jgi:hypothetical protein
MGLTYMDWNTNARILDSVLEAVGRNPLLRLQHFPQIELNPILDAAGKSIQDLMAEATDI